MKTKSLFIILFLISVILLSGCAGVVTPATDEAKVKSVIQNFFLAINDQNWSKAKSYCVYGSDVWFIVMSIEDAMNTLYYYYNLITINCFINISNITVNGSYGSAKVTGSMVVTADGYIETEDISGIFHLQKIGNNWKIY